MVHNCRLYVCKMKLGTQFFTTSGIHKKEPAFVGEYFYIIKTLTVVDTSFKYKTRLLFRQYKYSFKYSIVLFFFFFQMSQNLLEEYPVLIKKLEPEYNSIIKKGVEDGDVDLLYRLLQHLLHYRHAKYYSDVTSNLLELQCKLFLMSFLL